MSELLLLQKTNQHFLIREFSDGRALRSASAKSVRITRRVRSVPAAEEGRNLPFVAARKAVPAGVWLEEEWAWPAGVQVWLAAEQQERAAEASVAERQRSHLEENAQSYICKRTIICICAYNLNIPFFLDSVPLHCYNKLQFPTNHFH